MRFVGPLLLLEFFPLSQLMLILLNWSTQDGMWRCVWHWDGPERIRMFIWLLIQQRILTNAERVKSGDNGKREEWDLQSYPPS